MINEKGAIYLAFGNSYLIMALLSIKSLKLHNPDLQVCLVTNIKLRKEDISILSESDHFILLNEEESNNRSIKTSINKISPFEKTIYIDCDTIIMNEIDDGFKFLNYFDIAIRLNPYPQTREGKAEIKILEDLSVRDCPHWNSGVIFFSNSAQTQDFFKEWNASFLDLRNRYDQVSLVKTIFMNNSKVLSLPSRWNASDPILGRRKWRKSTKIFHYATNISNSLKRKLIKEAKIYNHLIPTMEQELKNYISERRNHKLRDIGIIKYVIARILWFISSPD